MKELTEEAKVVEKYLEVRNLNSALIENQTAMNIFPHIPLEYMEAYFEVIRGVHYE